MYLFKMRKIFLFIGVWFASCSVISIVAMENGEQSVVSSFSTEIVSSRRLKIASNKGSYRDLISRIAYHFTFDPGLRISIINKKFAENLINDQQLKKIFKAILFDNQAKNLDVTELITVIQAPVWAKLEKVRNENNSWRKSCNTFLHDNNINIKNNHELFLSDQVTQLKSAETLKSERNRGFFEKYPKTAMICTGLVSLPLYFGLHQVLKHYNVPYFS